MKPRQIILNYNYAGALVNTTIREFITETLEGDARNATGEDLAAVSDTVAAGYLAQISALEADHAAALEAKDAEIHKLRNPLDPATARFLALPPDVRAAFAGPYKIARALLRDGEKEAALDFIVGLKVPKELEAERQAISIELAKL